MTARKPKPKPRKASGPTQNDRIDSWLDAASAAVTEDWRRSAALEARVAALESRDRLRDKSHDAPVSNAAEAIGHFTLTEVPRPWWRRLLGFMGQA